MTPALCREPRWTEESLDEGERIEWKGWLKPQYEKADIMASSPITSWEIDGETMEIETDFIFEDSKITDKSCCSLKIKKKKKPAPWKKNYDKCR